MFRNTFVFHMLTVLPLLAFQTTLADESSNSDRKVLLIPKYHPGIWLVTRTIEGEQESIADGKKIKIKSIQIYKHEIHIDNPESDGNKRISVQLKRFSFEQKAGDNVMIIDSDEIFAKDNGDEGQGSKKLGVFGLLLKAPIVGSIEPDGTVKYVSGLNEYAEECAKQRAIHDSEYADLTQEKKNQICQNTLKLYLPRTGSGCSNCTELLPTTPVGVGDTWVVEEDFPALSNEQEGFRELKYKCRLKHLKRKSEGTVATVKFTGQGKSHIRHDSSSSRQPDIQKSTQKISGHYKFNLERGMLIEQELITESQHKFSWTQPSKGSNGEQDTIIPPAGTSVKSKRKTRLKVEPVPSSTSRPVSNDNTFSDACDNHSCTWPPTSDTINPKNKCKDCWE